MERRRINIHSAGNAIKHTQTAHDTTEHNVLAVPALATLQTHEELTAVTISTGVRHRQRTAIIRQLKRLVFELAPRIRVSTAAVNAFTALPVSANNVAALHALFWNHAVELSAFIAQSRRRYQAGSLINANVRKGQTSTVKAWAQWRREHFHDT